MTSSVREQRFGSVYFRCGGLALAAGVGEAFVAGLVAPAGGFSWADFGFAFILTYAIGFGIFSKDRRT
jgi:hypothetical protein